MAEQFDMQSGFDISGLTSVTKAQLMQMVNEIAPLANIGGVIWMSGAAGAHPDITNNARFIRYLWIDTQTAGAPVPKYYVGTYPSDTYADWETITVANGSLTAAKLADYAVSILNLSGQSKIAYKQDGTGSTKTNYLLRLDTAGRYVEVVDPSTVVQNVDIGLDQLPAGSSNQVLATSPTTGLPEWTTLSTLITIASNSLALATLSYGANAGYILRNSTVVDGGTGRYPVEVVTNSDKDATGGLFPDNSIYVSRLYAAAAASFDKIRFNGTNWVKTSPYFAFSGSVIPAPTSGASISVAHGLGAVPRIFRCLLIPNTTDIGYTSADTVDASGLSFGSAASGSAVVVRATSTNVIAIFGQSGGATTYTLLDTTSRAKANITVASWNVWFYAEL